MLVVIISFENRECVWYLIITRSYQKSLCMVFNKWKVHRNKPNMRKSRTRILWRKLHRRHIFTQSECVIPLVCGVQRVLNDYKGTGFLEVVWFGSTPAHSPPHVTKLDRRHKGETTCWLGKGAGVEPNHTIAWKPGLLLIIQNSLVA
jgi:hypothetical protein